jgi:hypothetical protein
MPAKNANENPPHYPYLNAIERQKFSEELVKVAQSRQGTMNDARLEPFKSFFHGLYQANPDAAALYYRNLINNPATMPVEIDENLVSEKERAAFKKMQSEIKKGLKGLSAKDKETYFDFMKKILTDEKRDYAIANSDTFNKLKEQINSFGIDNQGRVKNKKLNNVESLVTAIATIEDGRKDGTFLAYGDDTSRMITELRGALGTLVEDEGFKLRDSKMFDHTVSEAAKKAILTDLKIIDRKYGNKGMFTKEQVGELTEKVWQEFIKQGIDTNSTNYDDSYKALLIERDVLKKSVNAWFGIEDKDFDAILYRGDLIDYQNSAFTNFFASAQERISGLTGVRAPFYAGGKPIIEKENIMSDAFPYYRAINDRGVYGQAIKNNAQTLYDIAGDFVRQTKEDFNRYFETGQEWNLTEN